MGFTEAVRVVLLAKYADFSGRARRSEYWWFMLFSCVLSMVLRLSATILAPIPVIGLIFSIVVSLIGLALMIPGIAVYVRRMHDLGKSGAFLFLVLVPLVNFYIIYLLTQPGEEGSNSFGANPRVTAAA